MIGNPPYVRPHKLESYLKEYFWAHYETFVKKADLYCCFIERAVELLKGGGVFGYIVSSGWLRLDSFENLRQFLLDETALDRIMEFPYDVFEDANVKTVILLFSKEPSEGHSVDVAISHEPFDLPKLPFRPIEQALFRHTYKSIFDLSLDESQERVKKKIRDQSLPLGTLFNLSFGLKTGDDSRFLGFDQASAKHKPLLRGEDVQRYYYKFKGEYVWYDPARMRAHRKTARPGTAERFEQPKVLIRDTGTGLQGTFDSDTFYTKDVLIISDEGKDANKLKALTAVLNSRLMRFYYETSFPTLHVQRDELAALPIHTIDFSRPEDKERHDRMVVLVEMMLSLHERLAEAKIEGERTVIQHQIDATDLQIDQLVYALYDLTDEEIEIVEQESRQGG